MAISKLAVVGNRDPSLGNITWKSEASTEVTSIHFMPFGDGYREKYPILTIYFRRKSDSEPKPLEGNDSSSLAQFLSVSTESKNELSSTFDEKSSSDSSIDREGGSITYRFKSKAEIQKQDDFFQNISQFTEFENEEDAKLFEDILKQRPLDFESACRKHIQEKTGENCFKIISENIHTNKNTFYIELANLFTETNNPHFATQAWAKVVFNKYEPIEIYIAAQQHVFEGIVNGWITEEEFLDYTKQCINAGDQRFYLDYGDYLHDIGRFLDAVYAYSNIPQEDIDDPYEKDFPVNTNENQDEKNIQEEPLEKEGLVNVQADIDFEIEHDSLLDKKKKYYDDKLFEKSSKGKSQKLNEKLPQLLAIFEKILGNERFNQLECAQVATVDELANKVTEKMKDLNITDLELEKLTEKARTLVGNNFNLSREEQFNSYRIGHRNCAAILFGLANGSLRLKETPKETKADILGLDVEEKVSQPKPQELNASDRMKYLGEALRHALLAKDVDTCKSIYRIMTDLPLNSKLSLPDSVFKTKDDFSILLFAMQDQQKQVQKQKEENVLLVQEIMKLKEELKQLNNTSQSTHDARSQTMFKNK